MTKTELKEEIKALKKMNAIYKSMLMKVQKYGIYLTMEENLINNKMVQEVKRKKK